MNAKPSENKTRIIEGSISLGNLRDQIAALLYAAGYVNDNEDIVRIELGKIDWKAFPTTTVPIKFGIKKQYEEVNT